MLLTFGLLSPNKGIENVIQALPQILAKHKNVVYIVAGATRPHILRREGDKYRANLLALAKEIGVESQVIFDDRFVSPEEMVEFMAPPTSTSLPIATKLRSSPALLLTHWERAKRSSLLHTGMPSSCWTIVEARSSHSKIPTRWPKKRLNFSTLLPFVTPCANVPTCSRARWSGNVWRRVTCKAFHTSAATAWRVQRSSSPRARLKSRWTSCRN